jgi:chemotaxis protein histidine kinase CheA
MAHDQLEVEGQTTRRGGGGRFIIAGVVGACALGVGLGLWARPSSAERGDAPPPPKPEVEAKLSDRRLQIVLDDTPAPIGQPLEVMPADTPGLAPLAPAEPQSNAPELTLPKGPPLGLMKVDAPIAAAPVVIPAVRTEPKPEPKSEPRVEKPKEEKAKVEKAKPAKAKVEERRAVAPKIVSKAEAKKAEAKTGKKPPAKILAQAAKPEKKKTPAERKKDRQIKLAKAEVAAKKTVAAEKPKLTKLVKAVKATPKKLKATATATAERKKKRDLELAEAREAKRAKARTEAAAKAKAKPAVEKASAPKKKPVPRGEGPMRMARNDSCVHSDPGEALVCADPRLNQRDRQLQRAFRDAEAAGVPASALRQQQERLRQARTAAARDGSWAVEDVYEARIAELNDLARDARDF